MVSRDIGASVQAALADLMRERAVIDDAIQKLQALVGVMQGGEGAPKRRGRPPGSGRKAAATAVAKGKRPVGRPKGSGRKAAASAAEGDRAGWSDAARAQARERMRKYWAARRGGDTTEAAPRKKRGRPPKVREPKEASDAGQQEG